MGLPCSGMVSGGASHRRLVANQVRRGIARTSVIGDSRFDTFDRRNGADATHGPQPAFTLACMWTTAEFRLEQAVDGIDRGMCLQGQ